MDLIIKSFIEKDFCAVVDKSITLAILYGCVLLAVLFDLASGVEKARRKKVLRTSYGFRRTICKLRDYFNVLMMFTLADIIASIWITLPFFTAIGAIGMVFIEGRSIWENKKDTNKGIEDLPDVLVDLMKNRDNIEQIVKILKENSVAIDREKRDDTEIT